MATRLAVAGIGVAVPPRSIAQPDAAQLAKALSCRTPRQARWLETLYKHTRVRRRGSVLLDAAAASGLRQTFFIPPGKGKGRGPTTLQRMKRYEKEAGPLAFAAVRQALLESGLPAKELTHLITVSCTGFFAPGLDLALVKEFGLSRSIRRTQIGFMGCHGALNGMQVALALAGADSQAKILLCAVELCSLHFQYGWDPGRVVANALFADGAAAVIAAPAVRGPERAWKMASAGSWLFPDSEDAMTWRVGNHGFKMTLSPAVPALIQAHLRPWLEAWLRENRLSIPRIRSWAIHPGGPRILENVAASLDLPAGATGDSQQILATCGNMSSPTVLFILERLRRRGAPRPCVALGFGPGLVTETALFL